MTLMEYITWLGLSMATVGLLVMATLWTFISRCPECGSTATRAVGGFDPRIRVCRTCLSLYKTGSP